MLWEIEPESLVGVLDLLTVTGQPTWNMHDAPHDMSPKAVSKGARSAAGMQVYSHEARHSLSADSCNAKVCGSLVFTFFSAARVRLPGPRANPASTR